MTETVVAESGMVMEECRWRWPGLGEMRRDGMSAGHGTVSVSCQCQRTGGGSVSIELAESYRYYFRKWKFVRCCVGRDVACKCSSRLVRRVRCTCVEYVRCSG